jgi:translation initiation factor 1
LKKLAKSLKQKCGTGGAVRNGMIEIQGDQRDVLEKELRTLGYTVKRAGA